ncbi:MAG TPA: glycosyltransferase family 39 protein [Chloroflexota bacterium]|nr:glycosyltransferase family 39 protein [Chloroflexota bacterium]
MRPLITPTPRAVGSGRAAPGLLLALLAGAAALRLWDLGGGPDPLDVDEGYTGLDALRLLRGGWTVYFAANNGAEPLYVYLAALTTALLGPSALALRLPAALAGTAAVLATFLLVRVAFRAGAAPPLAENASALALLTALLQTLSLWHLHLSRDASRVGLLPLLATLGCWLLWEGLRRPRAGAGWFAGAGFCFGLALYTYLPARLLPLLVAALLAHLALSRRAWLAVRWPGLLLTAGVASLVAAPLAAYYLTHGSAFLFRVEMVSLLNPWVHGGDPLGLLARNLVGTVGMFAVQGDLDAQYNVSGQPVFPLPLALLFVLGLGVAAWRLREPACAFFLLWLGLLLLPGVLSANSPHFARQAGILPAVYVFPALGAWQCWRWVQRRAPAALPRSWLAGGGLALLVGSGLTAVADYFGRPAAPGPTLLARLATLPPAAEVYVAGSEETATVGSYLSGLDGRLRFTQGFHSLLLPRDPANTLYLVEREWWWLTAEQLLWARYDLVPLPAPPGLERFRVLRLAPRPGPEPWAPLPPVGWAVGARLVGYGLPPEARPGEVVGVTLRWRVEAPAPDDPGQDYTFAVALVDARGEEVARRDWLGHPTAAWRAGDEVVSWFDLCLPPALPPGPLQATVALYSRADFVTRPLLDAAGVPQGMALRFGTLQVAGPPQQPPCGARIHPALPP